MKQSAFSTERPPRLVSVEEPLLAIRRSYFTELIESVFAHGLESTCKPVMFVSPNAGAGVSFICSYVATELASAGGRVLLIDAGTLLAVVRGSVEDPMRLCERIDMNRLWVLGPKQIQGLSSDARSTTSTLSSILRALRDGFSHIVIDAPALSNTDDAVTLASSVHGTVLVAQSGLTGKQEIVKTRERFVSLGGRVLGSVYNARLASATEAASI